MQQEHTKSLQELEGRVHSKSFDMSVVLNCWVVAWNLYRIEESSYKRDRKSNSSYVHHELNEATL